MKAASFILFADRAGVVVSGVNIQVASGKRTEAGAIVPDGYFTRFNKSVGSVHSFDPRTGKARLLYQDRKALPAAFPPDLLEVLRKVAENPG